MTDDRWLMRVESGLSAHFHQPGGSVPGVMWSVSLKRGDETHQAMVKALLVADASRKTRADQQYQARTVMQYLQDEIDRGWNPAELREHLVWIGDPSGEDGASPSGRPVDGGASASAGRRPWWKFW